MCPKFESDDRLGYVKTQGDVEALLLEAGVIIFGKDPNLQLLEDQPNFTITPDKHGKVLLSSDILKKGTQVDILKVRDSPTTTVLID